MSIRSSHLLSVVVLCGVVAGLCLAALLSSACTPPAEGQPPQFAVQSARVSGELEVATQAGVVLVDLDTGLVVAAGDGAYVVRSSVVVEVDGVASGVPVSVVVGAPGIRTDGEWRQCYTLRLEWAGLRFEPSPWCPDASAVVEIPVPMR